MHKRHLKQHVSKHSCSNIQLSSKYGFKLFVLQCFQLSIFLLAMKGLDMDQMSSIKSLRTLRALRPLRAVSRWEGMRVSCLAAANGLVVAVCFFMTRYYPDLVIDGGVYRLIGWFVGRLVVCCSFPAAVVGLLSSLLLLLPLLLLLLLLLLQMLFNFLQHKRVPCPFFF